ncbi:MAG: nucleotidyltransferase domain-containing protein [Bacillota bacterium]
MQSPDDASCKGMSISVESLREHLESDQAIDMAFLFGSVAKGTDTKRSDIDVAVHFSGPYGTDDVFRLAGELERLLSRDVDLIVLNSAPASLAWTAIRGVRLFVRNQGAYVQYMLDVSREAEDFGHFASDLWKMRRKRRAEAEATAHGH